MAESQEVEAQWRLELKDLPTLQRLGRGLSGYLYETKWGGKKCARKDFPLGSAERNSLFETEVKQVCKLDDHPNIVKCFGYTVGRSSCSLVQEYVADNLQNSVQRRIDQEVIRKKGTRPSRVLDVGEIKHLLSSRGKEKEKGKGKVAGSGTFEAVPEAVDIISQIATGMRFLHENGVVHGDLKPRNVLLLDSESGALKVKLADYGLTETKKRIRMVSERTRRAEILTWKAPECLGKNYVNHDDPFAESDTDSDEETVDEFFKSKLAMADVYSFGLTCSYVLGGKLMSPDMSLAQLRQQRMQGFKPKLPESASLEHLKLMIDSCLQPEPLKRPTFAAICSSLGMIDWGSSLPHLPSKGCLPSSLEDRSVDSPEQISTMPTSARASRELSHSSMTSCMTRKTSPRESLELIPPEGDTTSSFSVMAGQDQQCHSLPEAGKMNLLETLSTLGVIGVKSRQKLMPFKPWRGHVRISAPFLRKNDRINQALLRRCIDMMRQIQNFQKVQHSVLSSSPITVKTETGIAHSPSDELWPLRPQASKWIANNMGIAPGGKDAHIEQHDAQTQQVRLPLSDSRKLPDRRRGVLGGFLGDWRNRIKALDKRSIPFDASLSTLFPMVDDRPSLTPFYLKDLPERVEEPEAPWGEGKKWFKPVQVSHEVLMSRMNELEQRNNFLLQRNNELEQRNKELEAMMAGSSANKF